MSNVDDVEEQAMTWLVRLETLPEGSAADDMHAEFAAWCDADPRRHAAYIRLGSAWRKADQLKRLCGQNDVVDIDLLAPMPTVKPSEVRANRGVPRFMGTRVALAASVAIVLVGSACWWALDRLSGKTYATAVGGFERVLLADGSMVELDTATKIKVRFNGDHREVTLVRGQANFNVIRDAKRPFSVDAGDTTVRALGTIFSVRLREARQVEVLVAEGRVAIAPQGSKALDIDRADVRHLPTLSAGEVAVIKPAQLSVKPMKVQAPDIERKLSWTHGRATFEGETLAEAVDEFNRYTRRQLIIADPAIAGIRVGGSFEPSDPESFVIALERSFGVKVQSADDEEVRLVRAPD